MKWAIAIGAACIVVGLSLLVASYIEQQQMLENALQGGGVVDNKPILQLMQTAFWFLFIGSSALSMTFAHFIAHWLQDKELLPDHRKSRQEQSARPEE
jgi:hypothetical protein